MSTVNKTVSGVEVVTISNIPGRDITENLGIVFGSSVQSRSFLFDIFATFRNMFGGEIRAYTKLLDTAQKEAVDRMARQAEAIGADAVVDVHFSTSQIAYKAAEIFAYGTAIKLK
ncbi:YbjQ family protein [Thalassospira sp.]|uniref:YbjQ family protein n=1 Tax=Thalassospira sp. TaxID=1912094 RepID=UPI0027343C76|nr:YbjQ family protein [Thalassospira sp.]MDP2699711.1 YbjQ family protein [Thalassospira sp.]